MDEDTSTRRGRPPRAEPASPTGYRCTDTVRQDLTLAMAFLGEPNLQAVIDRFVREGLSGLHRDLAGFSAASADAAASRTGAANNVTHIRRGSKG